MTQLSNSNINAVADLKPGYTLGAADVALLQEMARRLLAAETQEPVAWISERNLKNLGKSYSVYVKHEPVMVRPIPLYAAPQPVAVPICPKCGDTGMADSGGVQPWGEPIEIPCDCRFAPQPVAVPDEEVQSEMKWRDLALQFDGHRMQSLCFLKYVLSQLPETEFAEAREFLKAGPLSGEEVLRNRIAAMLNAEPVSQPYTLPQWIPCSERMPDTNGEYYLTHSNAGVDVTYFDEGRFFDKYATHWMPLPAAPQEPTK